MGSLSPAGRGRVESPSHEQHAAEYMQSRHILRLPQSLNMKKRLIFAFHCNTAAASAAADRSISPAILVSCSGFEELNTSQHHFDAAMDAHASRFAALLKQRAARTFQAFSSFDASISAIMSFFHTISAIPGSRDASFSSHMIIIHRRAMRVSLRLHCLLLQRVDCRQPTFYRSKAGIFAFMMAAPRGARRLRSFRSMGPMKACLIP